MGELIFNALLLLVFVGMTIYSGSIEIWQGYVGARYYPMFLLIVADLIFAAKTFGVYKKIPKEAKKVDFSFMNTSKIRRLLLAFLLTIVYAFVMTPLGFYISTFLYAILLSAILGLKNIVKLVLSSFVITTAIYAIFVWALDIMVPRGAGALYYFGLWLETLL